MALPKQPRRPAQWNIRVVTLAVGVLLILWLSEQERQSSAQRDATATLNSIELLTGIGGATADGGGGGAAAAAAAATATAATATATAGVILGEDNSSLSLLSSSLLSSSLLSLLSSLSAVGTKPKKTAAPPKKAKDTIAYIITLTECSADGLLDGAAVLAHSIHWNSFQSYDVSQSLYDYKLYAMVHPEAKACSEHLSGFNYTVMIQDSPVAVQEIQSANYRKRIQQNGCCGEREFLKLYALTLHNHTIVVVFDMDSLLLKPMDPLFDAMLLPDNAPKSLGNHAMWPRDATDVTRRIHSYFTRDYIATSPDQGWRVEDYPVQGGFWVVRPNQTAFEEFRHLIRVGNFSSGWFDQDEHYKTFYGAPTIQGLLPWYYGHLHPDQSLELDHCLHNNQVYKTSQNGKCIVPLQPGMNCRDCRTISIDELYSWHGTWCGKPWECQMRSDWAKERFWRCQELLSLWFQMRHKLETESWGRKHSLEGMTYLQKHSYGYCNPKYSPMMKMTVTN